MTRRAKAFKPYSKTAEGGVVSELQWRVENDILENGLGGDRGRVDTIVGVHHRSVYPVLFSGRVFDAVALT